MPETGLEILIRPGIPPDSRHKIEDTLERLGYDVAGGGGFEDGSESDIMIYVGNPAKEIPRVVNVLRKSRIGQASVIRQVDSDVEYSVYGDGMTETMPKSNPWWKFW